MGWLLQQGTTPDVIPNGSCVMSIFHNALKIRVIDSLNFLAMPLAKLPACFGLTELTKGFFPHLFNTSENQNYVGTLPSEEFYSPDSMKSDVRKSFLEWHKERKNDVFDFAKEILAYCRSDVDILRRCCLEYRKELLNIANVDPFRYITIASSCMAIYRNSHLQPNTIAMVPVNGYSTNVKYSPDSIRWLDFIAKQENIFIQHALNKSGERKIGGAYVDGFCEETLNYLPISRLFLSWLRKVF
nr:probable DNA polymerase [Parasteatoda tepidariorum]